MLSLVRVDSIDSSRTVARAPGLLNAALTGSDSRFRSESLPHRSPVTAEGNQRTNHTDREMSTQITDKHNAGLCQTGQSSCTLELLCNEEVCVAYS